MAELKRAKGEGRKRPPVPSSLVPDPYDVSSKGGQEPPPISAFFFLLFPALFRTRGGCQFQEGLGARKKRKREWEGEKGSEGEEGVGLRQESNNLPSSSSLKRRFLFCSRDMPQKEEGRGGGGMWRGGFGKRSGEEGLRGSKEGEETSFCQYWMQKNPFTVLSYGTSESDMLLSTAHLNVG